MNYFDVDIKVNYEKMGYSDNNGAVLNAYILGKESIEATIWKKRPAVVICPGGGYGHLSPREGEAIALKYCSVGFHSFVLKYSVAPYGWPSACCELSKAVAYVRSIADEYNIDSDRIIVCGFSAGGHLAASLGAYYDMPYIKELSGVGDGENKPNGMVLCYPVTTNNVENQHVGSYENFVAGNDDAKKYFAIEENINSATPPAFLWHMTTDGSVPVAGTIKLAGALIKNGIDVETHIFNEGVHGMALADETTAVDESHICPKAQCWFDLSVDWIKGIK